MPLVFFQHDYSDLRTPSCVQFGRRVGRAGSGARAYAPAVLDVADFVGGGVDTVRAHQDVCRRKRPLLQKPTRVAQPHRVAVTDQHVLLLRSMSSPTPSPTAQRPRRGASRLSSSVGHFRVKSGLQTELKVLSMALDRVNSKLRGHQRHTTNGVATAASRPNLDQTERQLSRVQGHISPGVTRAP